MPAADNCPDCGGTLKKLGEDASEVLEYIPAKFVVIRHVRPRMCCSRCDTILQAPVPVLAPGNGKTKTGRLWTYVRDDRPAGSLDAPAAWFAYSPDRRGEHPQQHLAKFQGILQADAFAGFDKLYKDETIQEAPCMAHIRRKFYDLVEAHRSPIAIEAVERIAALYAIEKEIRGRPPEVRQKVRSEKARPLLDAMHAWLEESLAKLSPKSVAAGAIRYALALWKALQRYCDDGRIEIDNNAAERKP